MVHIKIAGAVKPKPKQEIVEEFHAQASKVDEQTANNAIEENVIDKIDIQTADTEELENLADETENTLKFFSGDEDSEDDEEGEDTDW